LGFDVGRVAPPEDSDSGALIIRGEPPTIGPS
jgi:hypothetical protein